MSEAQASRSYERALALIGLLTLGGLPTFVITVTLSSIGVSFIVSGAVVFLAGIMGLMGAWQLDDSPIKAVLVGPPLALVGALALAGLAAYFWVGAKVVRKLLAG